MVVWQRPNLLVMDEPTNHLDMDMRHALTVALQGYEGAMILVTHDRHLLRNTVDELMLVHAGRRAGVPTMMSAPTSAGWCKQHHTHRRPGSGSDGKASSARHRPQATAPSQAPRHRAARQRDQTAELETGSHPRKPSDRNAELDQLLREQGRCEAGAGVPAGWHCRTGTTGNELAAEARQTQFRAVSLRLDPAPAPRRDRRGQTSSTGGAHGYGGRHRQARRCADDLQLDPELHHCSSESVPVRLDQHPELVQQQPLPPATTVAE